MNAIPVEDFPGIAGKVRRKRREYELELQISVIQWADLQAKCGTYPELSRLFAIPNGGMRTAAEAGKFRASGVRPGVPDLCLPVARGGFHSLWMELKHGDNEESAAQSDWLDWLHAQGHFAVTCRTFDAATSTLTEYLDGKHVRSEVMAEKACTRCKVVKPLEDFYASKSGKDGRSSACRACLRATYSDARQRMPGYMCWREMNSRCRNPKAKSYPDYGGRGITVFPEWQGRGGYERFIAHIGPRPTPEHQIDRINNDGNYEPGNVRWVLRVVNMRNRSITKHLTLNGETKPVAEWAEQFGISGALVCQRLRDGWTSEQALLGKAPQDGITEAMLKCLRSIALGERATTYLRRRCAAAGLIDRPDPGCELTEKGQQVLNQRDAKLEVA